MSPAYAGMIPVISEVVSQDIGEPRIRGDDPLLCIHGIHSNSEPRIRGDDPVSMARLKASEK